MQTEVNELSDHISTKRYLRNDHILTVLLCAISIPLSMSLWIINILYSKFIKDSEGLDGKYKICSGVVHKFV